MEVEEEGKLYYFKYRLADAAEVPLQLIRRVHMIGELTKGSCSMFGAWGDATDACVRRRAAENRRQRGRPAAGTGP